LLAQFFKIKDALAIFDDVLDQSNAPNDELGFQDFQVRQKVFVTPSRNNYDQATVGAIADAKMLTLQQLLEGMVNVRPPFVASAITDQVAVKKKRGRGACHCVSLRELLRKMPASAAAAGLKPPYMLHWI
jgi:hypothetical protein